MCTDLTVRGDDRAAPAKRRRQGAALLVFAFILFTQLPLPGIGFAVAVLLCFFRPTARRSTTYGAATWAGLSVLRAAGCLGAKRGFVLGRTILDDGQRLLPVHKRPECSVPDSGPPHLAVYGPSGSGKTQCFVLDNVASDPAAVVVIDPKAEIFKLTSSARRRRHGQDIVVFDPFGLSTKPDQRARFNPLLAFRDDPELIIDEARRLASALVVRPKDEKDPFWNSAAQVVIQTVLAFLMAHASKEEATLAHARALLTNPLAMDELLEYIKQSPNTSQSLKQLAGTVRWYQNNAAASIYAVANTHLEFLDSAPLSVALSGSTFDPRNLVDGRQSIYVCLPVDRLQELAGFQRILVSSLINLIFRAGEDRHRRVRFYLDEASTLKEIDSVNSALVYGRSYGIRLAFFFQSIGQITQCFPDTKALDFQATTVSVFCGVNDYRTAQEVSQWIGQTTVRSRSTQESWNQGTSWNSSPTDQSQGGNSGYSRSDTQAEVARALIQPEEVLQLPASSAIALLPGIPPILLEKIPHYAPKRRHRAPRRPIGRMITRAVLFIGLAPFVLVLIRGAMLGSMQAAVREADNVIKRADAQVEAWSDARRIRQANQSPAGQKKK